MVLSFLTPVKSEGLDQAFADRNDRNGKAASQPD
jgi:hypothetical protein